jgi:hypothetical protein
MKKIIVFLFVPMMILLGACGKSEVPVNPISKLTIILNNGFNGSAGYKIVYLGKTMGDATYLMEFRLGNDSDFSKTSVYYDPNATGDKGYLFFSDQVDTPIDTHYSLQEIIEFLRELSIL